MANSEFIDKALQGIATELISGFTQEIADSGRTDTGASADPNSFIVSIQDGVLTITSSLPYMAALDSGRGPTKNSGDGEVRRQLEGWIRRKNLQLYKYVKGHRYPVSSTDSYVRKTAYVMARSIHKNGFSGTQFASNTINRLSDSIQQRLGDAYAKQIEQIMNNRR